MTSQKSYSESRIPGMFASKYFTFSLLGSWPHLVFYFVVLVFTIPVPLLLGFNDMTSYSAESRYRLIGEMYQQLMFIVTIVSGFIAVFAGMTTMSYVNSKVSVNFYHSLPLRREGHYITSVLVRYVNYLIPLILNLILGGIVAYANDGIMNLYLKTMFGLPLAYAIIFFSLIYFITVLAGMIAGNGAIRFVLTMWILGAPFCVYAGIIQSIGYGSKTFYEGYYFRFENIKYLSPVIRIAGLYNDPFTFNEVIGYIAATLVIAVISCVLYMKRKSERAGDTVVYKTAGTVIKYISMFILTLYVGIWFKSMGSSEYWLIFGFICGCVLSFMLINTILHKNARQMFMGIKGFIAFALCFTAFFTVTGYDVFDIDSKFPSASMVSEITLTTEDELTFKNQDDIEFILDKLETYHLIAETFDYGIQKKFISLDDETEIYGDITYEQKYLLAYIKLPLGITIARSYHVNIDTLVDIYKFINESDELDEYFKDIKLEEGDYISLNTMYVRNDGSIENWATGGWNSSDNNMLKKYEHLAELAVKPLENGVSRETFNKVHVGSVYIGGKIIPVFSDNTEFFEELAEIIVMEDVGYTCDGDADIPKAVSSKVKEAYVYDLQLSEIKKYTDKDEIAEIFKNITSIGSYFQTTSAYVIHEPRYRVLYTTDEYSEEMKGYGYRNDYSCVAFREGMVPDFIK